MDSEKKAKSLDDILEQERKEKEEKRIRRITTVLEDMREHLHEEAAFARENIQNSLDAGATKIEINYSYNKEKSTGKIRFKDNGTGMSYTTIHKELLTLFESKKEDNITKIGRFGIGFISNFAQKKLERVTVTTNTGEKEHIVHLLPPKNGWKGTVIPNKGEFIHQRGTSVTLDVSMNEEEFQLLEKTVSAYVEKTCAYTPIPLFVEGKKINKPFDIPEAKYKIKFGGGSEIEGVIGLIEDNNTNDESYYKLFNRRLLVEEDNKPLFKDVKGLSILISSSYLKYDLSRDYADRDIEYEKIILKVKEEVDNLYLVMIRNLAKEEPYVLERKEVELLNYLELLNHYYNTTIKDAFKRNYKKISSKKISFVFKGSEFIYNTIKKNIEEAIAYDNESKNKFSKWITNRLANIDKKELLLKNLTNEMKYTKFITGMGYDEKKGVYLKKYNLDEVIGQAIEEKSILSTDIQQKEIEPIVITFLKKNKIIIPATSTKKFNFEKDPQRNLLELFYNYQIIEKKYNLPNYLDERNLSAPQQKFINTFRQIVRASPLNSEIGLIAYTKSSSTHYKTYKLGSVISEGYTTKKKVYTIKRSGIEKIRDHLSNRDILMINMEDSLIKKAIRIAEQETNSPLAYTPLLASLAYHVSIDHKDIPRKVEKFINEYFIDQKKEQVNLSPYKIIESNIPELIEQNNIEVNKDNN